MRFRERSKIDLRSASASARPCSLNVVSTVITIVALSILSAGLTTQSKCIGCFSGKLSSEAPIKANSLSADCLGKFVVNKNFSAIREILA